MSDQATFDAVLRTDFGVFVQKVFRTLNPGATFHGNWHIDAIVHALERTRSGSQRIIIINVPPRSLKSIIASVALPAFLLGHKPGVRLICVSYAQPLAAKLSRDFRRVIDSPWYARAFPSTVLNKATDEIIETTRGGARLSTSVGGVVTGFGGDVIIIDDPIKPDEAPSQVAREGAIRYYREVLATRLDNKLEGSIILVMQRLHEDDLAGHLLREGGWTHLCFPATATADELIDLGGGWHHQRRTGDLLQPSREPQSVLEEQRRNLGAAAFEAQYQQSPVPPTGNMIESRYIQWYDKPPPRGDLRLYQSWDTALKGDARADYSVCITWGECQGRHYLLDVFRQKMDFAQLLNAAGRLYQEHPPEALLIEDKGSGTTLIQELRRLHNISAVGQIPKIDKETRLSTVVPMFEAHQVIFPRDAPWLPDFLHELYGFPQARHDDQVDSLSQYLAWARDRFHSSFFSWDFGDQLIENKEEESLWYPQHIR